MKKTDQNDNSPEIDGVKRFPASHDLLYLAVQLAGGSKFSRDEATEYVERAFWLWAAADRFANPDNREAALKPRLSQYSKGNKGKEAYAREISEYQRATEEFFRKVVIPKKYPIDFDGFLALILPKRKTEERYKVYRDYLRHSVRSSKHAHKAENIDVSKLPLPRITEVADIMDRHRSEIAIKNESEFIAKASPFFEWYNQYQKLNKSERGKKARKVSGTKKVVKKASSKKSY
ncbi:hypothetical protein N8535_00280 [bacterium]|nr:hypothetical protein [bacterium]